MKNLFGIISIGLGLLSVYLVFTCKTGYDVVLAVACLLMAVIFMCFMIMEEQKERIERLQRKIHYHMKTMEYTGRRDWDDNTTLDIYKDRKGQRWFTITETK